ncbi:MAG: hypothetical protein GKR88_19375 [Flavobacteriaceae bacterium]|nr:MAG: hypothetical protein GKR88_19365 [Flavobacteriaceae bacterium]QMU66225.1 MAG: hypothetical protein GKR88_19375 [Flavobacteriaceae bacterium]
MYLVLIILFNQELQAQTKIISLSSYFKGKGVIFEKEYKSLIDIKDYEKSFTPSLEEIKIVENLFLKKIESKRKIKKTPKKEFYNYYRQYLGYINSNQEKVIMVNMLNFNKKSKAKRMFENWDKDYVLGFGEFYEENQFIYTINLLKKTLQIC